MMKLLKTALIVLFALIIASPAFSANQPQIAFHGDFNHRFMLYTNHNDWLKSEQGGTLASNNVEETWGDIKYRFWVEAVSDDASIKGVYAIEIGAIHFGKPGTGKSTGGSYSGDGLNLETRWAYTDIKLPMIDHNSSLKIGLQPFTVNPFLWKETAMGLNYNGSLKNISYQFAWMRTYDADTTTEDDGADDGDNYLLRLGFKPNQKLKTGLFMLYEFRDAGATTPADLGEITSREYLVKKMAKGVDFSIVNLGIDGSYSSSKFFFNWDAIIQSGEIKNASFDTNATGNFDLSAWFIHADVGLNIGRTKLTYTFWYASGDNDSTDNDFDGYLAIDLDRSDSIAILEGNYADDDVFSERNYLLDKGMIMNKLAADYKVTDKLKLEIAALYMMTAEDVSYIDDNNISQNNNDIGFELDGYLKYQLFTKTEVAFNAGYLLSGDAMDFFENQRDGNGDENILITSARIRYKF